MIEMYWRSSYFDFMCEKPVHLSKGIHGDTSGSIYQTLSNVAFISKFISTISRCVAQNGCLTTVARVAQEAGLSHRRLSKNLLSFGALPVVIRIKLSGPANITIGS